MPALIEEELARLLSALGHGGGGSPGFQGVPDIPQGLFQQKITSPAIQGPAEVKPAEVGVEGKVAVTAAQVAEASGIAPPGTSEIVETLVGLFTKDESTTERAARQAASGTASRAAADINTRGATGLQNALLGGGQGRQLQTTGPQKASDIIFGVGAAKEPAPASPLVPRPSAPIQPPGKQAGFFAKEGAGQDLALGFSEGLLSAGAQALLSGGGKPSTSERALNLAGAGQRRASSAAMNAQSLQGLIELMLRGSGRGGFA